MTADLDAVAERPPTGPVLNRVNPVVFGGSLVGVLLIAIWCISTPEGAGEILGVAVTWTAGWFGWFYILLATCVVAFVVFVAISRYGRVRLGPDHSRPEYSTFSWAAMLFAAGIGTDLMFFSVAEPVSQYLTPPRGEGQTLQAAKEGTVWTLFHYGITGWSMYALMGMALAYFAYRRGLPLAIRSVLAPVFGRRIEGGWGNVVDIAANLGTIFGVATSLGIGVVQLNVGLGMLFGVEQGLPAQIVLVVVAVVMAAISATTGVDKGIRLLSQINVILAIAIAAWVLVTGRTQFLLNALVMNVGDLLWMFPQMTADTLAYDQPFEWMESWTLFFWAWWIAWASFVGLFLARISRGRTIRQFVLGCLVFPFSYIVMWVSIFGNSAIDRIRQGDSAFGAVTAATPEQGFYQLLTTYPGAGLLVGLATFVGLLFYVTSADSGSLVMANLCSQLGAPDEDGKPWLRIVWAATTGLLTIAVLAVGGIPALQSATVIMGLPFAFVMVLVMFGLWKALGTEAHRSESGRHVLPQALAGRGGGQGSDRQLSGTWRSRLRRALQQVSTENAKDHLSTTVLPALTEVAEELGELGCRAEIEVDEAEASWVELRCPAVEGSTFLYRIEVDEVPATVYGGRMVRSSDTTNRLEVHTDAGGQGYDVMGYTRGQVIHDVLDQYERHLEFVRLETIS